MNHFPHAPIRADLKAFADGELPLLARFRVARHLRTCSSCREELNQMQTLSNELRENEAEETPLAPELRERILEQMPAENPVASQEFARRRRRIARKKTVLALGVCSLAGAIVFTSLQNARGPQSALVATDSNGSSADQLLADKATSSHDSSVVVGGAGNPAPPSSVSAASSMEADRASGTIDKRESNAIFSDGHAKSLDGAQFARNERIARRGVVDAVSAGASAAKSANSSTVYRSSVDDYANSIVPQSRVVHREGSLTVAVQDAETASDNATSIIKNVGGFIAQTSLETGSGQKRTAVLDCRVPVEKFEIVVSKIGQLGSVRAKSLNGQDITAQVAQSGARRQALSQELSIAQARLNKIENAKKPDQYQIAESRADVRAVRLQAAQARAQLETLSKYGSLSSLYVSLQEGVPLAKPANAPDSLSPTTRAAWNSFLSNARLPLQLALWILAYSPLWLPALLVWRKFGRKWLEA